MDVEVHSRAEAVALENPGKQSVQLLWRENAPDAAVTVTHVAMAPGAVSPRHSHPGSEQIWIVESGTATLLWGEDKRREIKAGDLVRTPRGHVHGIENTGAVPFLYLTVTCPPEDMTRFYGTRHDAAVTSAGADPMPTEAGRAVPKLPASEAPRIVHASDPRPWSLTTLLRRRTPWISSCATGSAW